MLERSAMLFRPVNIDDTVLLPVEDVDRSKLDPPNLHALVIDVIGEVGYKLAVTSGVLKGVFSRHHFKHSPTNFLSRSDIDFERVDLALRTAFRLQSFNKDRKPTKCGCKGNCSNKHCKCKKNNFSCNSCGAGGPDFRLIKSVGGRRRVCRGRLQAVSRSKCLPDDGADVDPRRRPVQRQSQS